MRVSVSSWCVAALLVCVGVSLAAAQQLEQAQGVTTLTPDPNSPHINGQTVLTSSTAQQSGNSTSPCAATDGSSCGSSSSNSPPRAQGIVYTYPAVIDDAATQQAQAEAQPVAQEAEESSEESSGKQTPAAKRLSSDALSPAAAPAPKLPEHIILAMDSLKPSCVDQDFCDSW